MIQALYLFQSKSKELIYNKNFQSDEKLQMFSSFFSALQTFVSELTESSTESLNTIELGEYFVMISRIIEISSDLVIITDKEDVKEVQKMIPNIIKILLYHKELFIDWDRAPEELEIFDLKIMQLVFSNKKLVGESSLTTDQSKILKSIWDQKGSLSEQIREDLFKKREDLNYRYLAEENYLKKYQISKKLIEISERLRDDEKFIEYQTESKSLRDEIKDRKLRLQYYLDKVLESINFSKYAETYSYLYSFCIKLEDFAESHFIEKYKALAKKLLSRKTVSREDFRQVVKDISNIEEELNEHFGLDT